MKNLNTLFFVILVFSFSLASAQTAPGIQWQNMIGGSSNEYLSSVIQTSDGGYFIGGYSFSELSIDKTEESQGGFDYWVLKLDASGNIQWQNTIGGSLADHLNAVIQTNDGGYLLGGYSYSGISGDKTEAGKGGVDYWVVKLNNSGTIEWQNTIGGASDDFLYSVIQDTNGDYVLGGYSSSGISGDKNEVSKGGDDYWVVKLNGSGNIVWQKTIGGSIDDMLHTIIPTTDGGYLLGGESASGISGDKTETIQGSYDYWVVKLTNTGTIEWQNDIGGSEFDFLRFALQSTDGGYLIGGYSLSGLSGEKTEASQGDWDYWVIKLNSTGAIQWQNTIGGKKDDILLSGIQSADGYYVLGGYSQSSVSGDKTAPKKGELDEWLVKLDGSGMIIWQKSVGGDIEDFLYSLIQTSDGGYLLGGYSSSPISDDVTEAANIFDYWIVKLAPEECPGFTAFADADNDHFGDAASDIFVSDCLLPEGYVLNSTDCNDLNAAVNPDAIEVANGIDDNCNGIVDENSNFCSAPVTHPESNITATSAQLNWNAVTDALSYKVRYKIKNTDDWTNLNSSSTHKTITGLSANTKYTWQVKSKCASNPSITSDWSTKEVFTTAPQKITTATSLQTALEIYPNPASENTTIHIYLNQSSQVSVKIFDVNGKEMQTLVNETIAAGDHSIMINTSLFSKGIYFVQFISEYGIQNHKLILQ